LLVLLSVRRAEKCATAFFAGINADVVLEGIKADRIK